MISAVTLPGQNAPGLENAPLHGRSDRPELAVAREPITRIDALESRAAREEEFREEIRFGDANVRGRRGKLTLGLADIRPSQQEFRRKAHRHNGRLGRDG